MAHFDFWKTINNTDKKKINRYHLDVMFDQRLFISIIKAKVIIISFSKFCYIEKYWCSKSSKVQEFINYLPIQKVLFV